MAEWKNEAEARTQIKEMIAQYYRDFTASDKPYAEGDYIPNARIVFDEKEMCA